MVSYRQKTFHWFIWFSVQIYCKLTGARTLQPSISVPVELSVGCAVWMPLLMEP